MRPELERGNKSQLHLQPKTQSKTERAGKHHERKAAMRPGLSGKNKNAHLSVQEAIKIGGKQPHQLTDQAEEGVNTKGNQGELKRPVLVPDSGTMLSGVVKRISDRVELPGSKPGIMEHKKVKLFGNSAKKDGFRPQKKLGTGNYKGARSPWRKA